MTMNSERIWYLIMKVEIVFNRNENVNESRNEYDNESLNEV